MEFLVDMVTTVPDGTTDAEVDAIRTREAARSRELAAQGHLLRLWRPPVDPGQWRTWGLFQAADATERRAHAHAICSFRLSRPRNSPRPKARSCT